MADCARSVAITKYKLPAGPSHEVSKPHIAAEEGRMTAMDWDAVEDIIGMGWFQLWLLGGSGLGFAADCMEVTLMAFVAPCVAVEWGLAEKVVLSVLGSCVFAGELAGCLIWGTVADAVGRRRSYQASCVLMVGASLLSALSPNLAILAFSRAAVGVGIGGLCVPFDLLCETTPTKHRGQLLLLMQVFWVFGSVSVVALAWGVLSSLGWRWLTGLACAPVLVACLVTINMPESPRWLMSRGRVDEAMATLRQAASLNGVCDERWEEVTRVCSARTHTHTDSRAPHTHVHGPVPAAAALGHAHAHTHAHARTPTTTFTTPATHSHRPHPTPPNIHTLTHTCTHAVTAYTRAVRAIFHRRLLRVTLTMWIVWFSFGLTYYGLVLYSASLFTTTRTRAQTDVASASSESASIAPPAERCTSFDYPPLLWSAASELGGVVMALLLLDTYGRRYSQFITYLLCGAAMVALGVVLSRTGGGEGEGVYRGVLLSLALVARATAMASSSCTWVAGAEAYPTSVRSTGHSLADAVSRIGAAIAPTLVGWGQPGSFRVAAVLAAGNLLAALAAVAVPVETGGRGLGERDKEDTERDDDDDDDDGDDDDHEDDDEEADGGAKVEGGVSRGGDRAEGGKIEQRARLTFKAGSDEGAGAVGHRAGEGGFGMTRPQSAGTPRSDRGAGTAVVAAVASERV